MQSVQDEMKNKKILQDQSDRLRSFAKKIAMLEASGDDIAFRNEFGKNWQISHEPRKYRHERYQTQLQELAKKHAFEASEIASLEQHLQEGTPLVLARDYETSEQEMKQYKTTRDWDTVILYKKILELRRQDKHYAEIAAIFNKEMALKKSPKKFTAEGLRKILSRGNKRVKRSE